MIAKKNITKTDKKLIGAVALLLVIALLVGVYFIISALAGGGDSGKEDDDFDLDLIEGESYYAGIPIAYPIIESSKMKNIVINKQSGNGDLVLSFALTRLGASIYGNNFVMSYTDDEGEIQTYIPDIAFSDSYFDYQELFAYTNSTSTASSPKITYITSALGALYFNDRIELSSDATERAAQLKRYGFEDEKTVILFTYTKTGEDGKPVEERHSVTIGDRTVNGSTYYFTVDDRPYVYVTRTNYFDYALVSFESFLHTTLVSAGLSSDGIYEPMFTPNYQQYTNTVYTYDVDEDGKEVYYYVKDGDKVSGSEPWFIGDNDLLVGILDARAPIDYGTTLPEGNDPFAGVNDDGYYYASDVKLELDLSKIKSEADYIYAINRLLGAAGEADNATVGRQQNLTLSVLLGKKNAEVKDGETVKYVYTVTSIEAVLGEWGEDSTVGTPVSQADAVKITYTYTVGGAAANGGRLTHAIARLSELPEAVAAQLSAMSVGDTPNYTFEIDYTDGSEDYRSATTVVITDIFKVTTEAGKYQQKVTESSVVAFRFYTAEDGVKVTDVETVTLYLSEITDKTDPYYEIKQFLIGKPMDLNQNLVASTTYRYCQPLYDFMTYEAKEISYSVRSEIVTSFGFINDSDRDPFFGESIYDNSIGRIDPTNPNRVYAINAASCETLVALLGGIGESATSSLGLKGIETVAVGITPEVMERYGLYAHTIYFELPRGIYEPQYAVGTELNDYAWYEVIGYTLYISETDPVTGLRYIGSEMYDIVASVNGSDFDFLESSFVELWARRNLLMIDVSAIDTVEASFNLSDFYGNYKFELDHDPVYVAGGKVYGNESQVPDNVTPTKYDLITIMGSLSGDASENAFTRYIAGKNKSQAWLGEFYLDTSGTPNSGYDNAGTGNFKYLLRMMYSLHYDGIVEEADKRAAEDRLASGEAEYLLTLKFKTVKSDTKYCYGFTRIDDRRVMVSIWYEYSDGVVSNRTSDFYLSTFAFKKILFGFDDLLNARTVDPELLPILPEDM